MMGTEVRRRLPSRIAITGAAGQLGREFCRRLSQSVLPLDLPEFDITDRRQVLQTLGEYRPQAIINCAAYTQVDRAEDEPEVCQAVNSQAVASLCEAAGQLDCPLVQISTDYVFGGADCGRPLVESDVPVPQGVYARTKLEGERQAQQWPKSFVVRTCGLFGVTPRRNNFVEAMLRLAAERPELRVVADQHCSPTYTGHLAAAVLFLLETEAYGLYHIVNPGAITWFEFAREILRQVGSEVPVRPITTAEYAAAAPRPRYSVLDISKYRALGGPRMPDLPQALSEYLAARQESAA